MNKFSIQESLSAAIPLFKKQWLFLVGITFINVILMLVVPMLVSGVISGLFSSPDPITGKLELTVTGLLLSSLSRLVFGLLSILISLGTIRIYLNVVEDKVSTFHDLFNNRELFLSFLVHSLIKGAVISVGFVLFIVPGIIFSLMFSFSGYVLVDEKASFVSALTRSQELTKGVRGQLLGFFLVCTGINILGLLCLGIGLLFTSIITTIGTAYVYKKLKSSEVLPTVTPTVPLAPIVQSV